MTDSKTTQFDVGPADIVLTTDFAGARNEWTFGTDGKLTFPSGNLSIGNYETTDLILGSENVTFGVLAQGQSGSTGIQWIDNLSSPTQLAVVSVNDTNSRGAVQISTGLLAGMNPAPAYTWTFGDDGNLIVPGHILAQQGNDLNLSVYNPTVEGQPGGVALSLKNYDVETESRTTQFTLGAEDIELITDFSGTQRKWIFRKDGVLQLPDDADIVASDGVTSVLGGSGNGYTGSAGVGYTGSAGENGYTGSEGSIGYTGSSSSVTVSSTAPSSPTEGDLWYDTTDGRTYIYYDAAWIDSNPAGGIGYTGSAGAGFTGSAGYTGSASTEVGYTGSAGTDGYTGSAGAGFVYRGEYVAGPTYVINDIVTYLGSTYICTGGNTDPAVTPPVTGYWDLLVPKGESGYTGSAGTGGSGDGYTGSAGADGYTGSAGADGYTGSAGADGYTGSEGYTGSAGSDGHSVYQGTYAYYRGYSVGDIVVWDSVFYVNTTGTNGNGFPVTEDPTNWIKLNGSSGTNGYTGSAGENGYTGSEGGIGYTGSAGAGFTGSAGNGIQSDWTQTDNSSLDYIKNKPALFDGNYNSLTNKPTYKEAVSTGTGPGGNNQADSLVLAGLNPTENIPSTYGGDLILKGGFGGSNSDLFGEVRIKSGTIGSNFEWHFTVDKKIKLPSGGDIVDSNGVSVLGGSGNGYTGSFGDTGYTGSEGTVGYTGSTGINVIGEWTSGSYSPGDIVTYNGVTYLCIAAWSYYSPDYAYPNGSWEIISGPIGYTGSEGATGYTGSEGYTGSVGQGFTFRYEWDSGTTYYAYDVVTYGGETFTVGGGGHVTEVTAGLQPFYDYFWTKIAAIGYTGSEGGIGYTGSEGAAGYTGSEGAAGYTGSAGINFAGTWNIGNSYPVNSVVYRSADNNEYISIQDVPGSAIDIGNDSFWSLFLTSGSNGYTGSAGSLPSDASGTLTNDGAGTLSWSTPWQSEGYVTGTPWTMEGYVTGTPWQSEGYLTTETQADWNETNTVGAAYINNKPDLSIYLTSETQSDWNESNMASAAYIQNRPDLSGYVTGTPWQSEGYVTGTPWTMEGYITSADVPTSTSQLSNDSGFITSADVPTSTSQLSNDSGFITSADVPTSTSQLSNDSGFITSADVPTDISQLTDNTGIIGSAGYTGSKGDAGYTGSKGDAGYTGSRAQEDRLVNGSYEFTLGSSGNLTLPAGGDIKDSNGISVLGTEPKFTLHYQNFNAAVGTRYCIDAVGQAVTATLPATPNTGDAIFFVDAFGSFAINNLTINGNGNTVMGSSTQVISTANESIGVFFNGAEWRFYG
jgi:hypothetical protein